MCRINPVLSNSYTDSEFTTLLKPPTVLRSSSSRNTRPSVSVIRLNEHSHSDEVAQLVRKSTYSGHFITSLNGPTRSNSSIATSAASGAQLSTENPGRFAASTRRLVVMQYSNTVRDRPEKSSTISLTSCMAIKPSRPLL